MSDTPQENRPLQIAIDGVPDANVLLTALSGTETLSRLYRYTCELAVPAQSPLEFPKVLGKAAVVSIQQDGGEWRYIHGVFSRVTESRRDERFVEYTGELVPRLWLMTRNRRSRLFQQKTTEEIIRDVVGGLYDLGDAFKLEGTYHPRNICAQYHESDFAFFSRLLEEEGWYYYFTHAQDKPGIVISDNPRGHVPVPGSDTLKFQDVGSNTTGEGRVTRWVKAQTLRTTTFDLTDHSFEMPSNQLEAIELLPDTVKAGTVTHQIGWEGADQFAVTQHPGGYVRWRDGVGPGGADRPDDLQHVFDDNARLARVRGEEELTGAVEITAVSTFNQVTPGHTFALEDHFDADGKYLVTGVKHQARCGAAASGGEDFDYANTFTAIPADVPFRPAQETPKPVIRGTQTAVVVGSDGAEIDPDKYGRVKVWFRWDPAGQRALDSSCWVRVAQFWAGKLWGAQFIPRVGDEVVVSFLNGDPDQPLIIGSVYNADNMPIYKLPDNKTQSGIKTHSSTGGTTETFNEIRFEDKKGKELVSIHAERDMSTVVEVNRGTTVGNNSTTTIGTDSKADPHTHGKSTTTIFGDTKLVISKGDLDSDVATGKATFHVKGKVNQTYEDTLTTTVTNDVKLTSTSGNITVEAPAGKLSGTAQKAVELKSTSDAVHVTGTTEVKLEVGAASILMKADGTIEIKGVNVTIGGTKVDVNGSALTTVMGGMVKINC